MTSVAARRALRFVLFIGVVSLFADMTYEGARSVTGPYLEVLGASATIVGVVAGLGEFVGYGLRLVSGYFADRTRRYWAITIAGYTVNMLAVPALALTGNWPSAAMLIVLERTGKAIRVPSRDAMLAHAAQQLGRGWVFGLHEALDQTGAMIGPLIVAGVLAAQGAYRDGFAVLLIPALLALTVLGLARRQFPRPEHLEIAGPTLADVAPKAASGFPRAFWMYVASGALVAAGFADFPLLAFHFKRAATVPDAWIPVLYALAMGVGALASLLFGRWFDRRGVLVLVAVLVPAAFFAPLAFLGGFAAAVLGTLLWGLGLQAHDSLMKSILVGVVPAGRRASAFGVFNAVFGVTWFIGSAAMGALYDVAPSYLVILSVALELAAVPILVAASRTGEPATRG